jgi:VWFA-related protein
MISKLSIALMTALLVSTSFAQQPNTRDKQHVRPVTVPISIYTKEELKSAQAEEYVQADRLVVKEDKDEQLILSIRSVSNSPLALAVLIQDEMTSDFNLQISRIATFIRSLPSGSRVLVGTIRGGNLLIRQKFTDDLDHAARSLSIVAGTSITAGSGPWEGVSDVTGRFEGLPTGRRAILLVSDGFDSTLGSSLNSSYQSPALERAISKAQKRSVAVYSIFSPTASTEGGTGTVVLSAQSALQRISDETGGRAFFQGTGAPVSFQPFFKELTILINRQFALTYLSTHMGKGFHRINVTSTNPQVKIEHPQGYYYH